MPTASTSQRPDSATNQRRSSLTTGSGSPRRSSVTESSISPRRASLTNKKSLIQLPGNIPVQKPRYLRRTSSSQEIRKDDGGSAENSKDLNQNSVPGKLNVRKISRRRSSTSGALLLQNDALTSPRSNGDENSPTSSSRKSSISSLPNSPRGKSPLFNTTVHQKSLSPRSRWMGASEKIKRRNSSTSNHFLSPAERLGTTFKYPDTRNKASVYTNENFIEGSLVMSSNKSIRALEFENKESGKEARDIRDALEKMEEEKMQLEVLEAGVAAWVGLLANIQRLSKGVPLMRSIRLVCLQMQKTFIENGGKYGASLLSLRRSKLPNVSKISCVMEEVRAKVVEGGEELSLVDGKFLEEVREILGRLEGVLAVTLAHYR
ncbi:uncharacterized protein LOC135688068 [Rhopilema esculentum]|uniref:uncharacterized protein LOC135688068 n=1 Tax=Rhopilema esculentum TaxID=499914 RepID=UPI0031E1105E|eukprot:gene7167-12832_t